MATPLSGEVSGQEPEERMSQTPRPAMSIATIEPAVVDVPLATPVQGVHGPTAVQRSVLVRVTTRDGHEGWGNVDPTPGYSPSWIV